MEKANLFTKLAAVMGSVGHVPKRGRNAFHKYDYVMEADLVDAVRSKLAESQIMLFTSVEESTKEGTLTTVKIKFTFVDGVGGEKMEVYGIGQGDDKGDKGVYKAITGAVKYMLMKNFLIPTGDDPEADEATDKRSVRQAPKAATTTETPAPSKAKSTPPAQVESEGHSVAEEVNYDATMARFFGLLDKLKEKGRPEESYKEFFANPRAKGPVPSLEVISTWSEPKHLEFLEKVCDKIEKEVA